MSFPGHYTPCGLYFLTSDTLRRGWAKRHYLPQVSVTAHSTILSTTSRTTLVQQFVNPSDRKGIREATYAFPLYDGVSIVAFTCHIGDRVIVGEVHGRQKAKQIYEEAVARGEQAGLLEQSESVSDVFKTSLGNIPPGATINVEITYLGELKHESEVDGLRFTIPTAIAPRYGAYPGDLWQPSSHPVVAKGFSVTVDINLDSKSFIKEIRSPSHPIAVSLGTTTTSPDEDPASHRASASLSLGTTELEKDFVLQVIAKEPPIPTAILETHPTIPHQRALMTTLVPRFNLKQQRPEIVFICDRSGSMSGHNIRTLIAALKVFLKSVPIGIRFNICSFGSRHSFLWPKSKAYTQQSLEEAMSHVSGFDANCGGTEMLPAVKDTFKRRYRDLNLEVFLVTDGEIWQQNELFELVNEETKKNPVRVFTLGIGDGDSHALIEGVARAGNGFSQSVGNGEKLEGKVVRMLKASLTPHIDDYSLSLDYGDGFIEEIPTESIVEPHQSPDLAQQNPASSVIEGRRTRTKTGALTKVISLFDKTADVDAVNPVDAGSAAKLPTLVPPRTLQAPHTIPPLFSLTRTSVYLLLSPENADRSPQAVILSATSPDGPLSLEIPIDALSQPGQSIHQLAGKKAMQDLEEGRGWLVEAKYADTGKPLKEAHESTFAELVQDEAARIGVKYQVAGKYCSFVAVEKKDDEQMDTDAEEYDFIEDELDNLTLSDSTGDLSQDKAQMAGPPPWRRDRRVHTANAASLGSDEDEDMGFGVFEDVECSIGADSEDEQLEEELDSPAPPTAASAAFAAARGTMVETSDRKRASGGPPADPLAVLVELQTWQGYWEWDARLFGACGVEEAKAAALLKKENTLYGLGKVEQKKRMLATALAIAFLEGKLAAQKESWELMAEKASEWLADLLGGREEAEKAIAAARALL